MRTIGFLATKVITEDDNIDFYRLSDGMGLYTLSFQNVGGATLVIDDGSGQEIEPGEDFIIDAPVPVANREFRVFFKPKPTDYNPQDKRVVLRYIYPVICKD